MSNYAYMDSSKLDVCFCPQMHQLSDSNIGNPQHLTDTVNSTRPSFQISSLEGLRNRGSSAEAQDGDAFENVNSPPVAIPRGERHVRSSCGCERRDPAALRWDRMKAYLRTVWGETSIFSSESDVSNVSRFPSLTNVSSDSPPASLNLRTNRDVSQDLENANASAVPNLRSGNESAEKRRDRIHSTSIAARSVANEGISVQGENPRGRPTLILRSTDSRPRSSHTWERDPRRSPSIPIAVNKVPNAEECHPSAAAESYCWKRNCPPSATMTSQRAEKAPHSVALERKESCCCNARLWPGKCAPGNAISDHLDCHCAKGRSDCHCKVEIQELKKELQEAKKKITEFSLKMEDKSFRLNQQHSEGLSGHLRPTSEYPELTPRLEEMSFPVFSQGSCRPLHQMCDSNRATNHGYVAHPSLGRTLSHQRYSYGDCDNRVPNYNVAPNVPPCLLRRHHDEGRRRNLDPSDLVSQLTNRDPQVLASLRDQIVALQMQNLELNLFLKKEELQREEVEEAVRRDRSYIRALEDNIQTLSSSRVVMDPLTYKQVADNYMASRKKPVRRTRTCNPYALGNADLVCDAQNQNLQVPLRKQSASCPSSPLGVKAALKVKQTMKKRLSQPLYDDDDSSSSPAIERSSSGSPISFGASSSSVGDSSDMSFPNGAIAEEGSATPCDNHWSLDASLSRSTPLNHEEYQRLLESIENMDVSSPS